MSDIGAVGGNTPAQIGVQVATQALAQANQQGTAALALLESASEVSSQVVQEPGKGDNLDTHA